MIERSNRPGSPIQNYSELLDSLPIRVEADRLDAELQSASAVQTAVLWHQGSQSLTEISRDLARFDVELRRAAAALFLMYPNRYPDRQPRLFVARDDRAIGVDSEEALTLEPNQIVRPDAKFTAGPRYPRPISTRIGHFEIVDTNVGSFELLVQPVSALIDIFSSQPVLALVAAYELSKPARWLLHPLMKTTLRLSRFVMDRGRQLTIRALRASLQTLGEPMDRRYFVAIARIDADGSVVVVWIGQE